MAKRIKFIGLAASVVLVLSLVLGSAIPVAEGAPAEKVVKVGLPLFITGALGTTGSPGIASAVDFFSSVNDQGGIGGTGIKLDWMWEDTGKSIVPGAITAHKRFIHGGVVAEISASVDQAEALLTRLQQDEIPLFMGTGHTRSLITRPVCWVFSSISTNQDEAAVGAKWFRDSWPEGHRPKVGSLIYDHVTGYEFDDGVKWACEHMDMEYIGREVVPVAGLLDSSTEWLRLVGKKADAIFTLTCGSLQVVTMKDAARLEVQGKGVWRM